MKYLAAIPLTLAICASCYAGNIVYSGSFTDGVNTADFTVTTDGNTGTLHLSDIVSSTVGENDVFFPSSSSGEGVSGDDLTATSTQLLFDFSDSNSGSFDFYVGSANIDFSTAGEDSSSDGDSLLCVGTGCANGEVEVVEEATGPQVIATAETAAAPEPGTWLMLLGGAILLYACRYQGTLIKTIR